MITSRHGRYRLAAAIVVALAAVAPAVDWSTYPAMVDRADRLLEENEYAVGALGDDVTTAVDTGLIPVQAAA